MFFRFSLSLLCKISHMTLSSRQKNPISQNNSLRTTFLHYSKYWGMDARAVPHPKFWVTVPPVPPRFPPMLTCNFTTIYSADYTPSIHPGCLLISSLHLNAKIHRPCAASACSLCVHFGPMRST